ncbi:MAG: YhbY family RNA-binding protein [Burkholderiales bacterium]|nr:YhbY family RNA-binding protein [Burkholderiales bacterium]
MTATANVLPAHVLPALTPAQLKTLKARAHPLHPVVTIGDKGLTTAVLREIDVNLRSHELIKVKAATDDRQARADLLVRICAELGGQPVQHIGKILVVFRPRPEEAAAAHEPAKRPAKRAVKRPARPAARPAAAVRTPGAGRPARAPRAARPGRTSPNKPRPARRPR